MALMDTIYKILGSKWFILFWTILGGVGIPFSYNQMIHSRNWMGPAIFVMNIIWVLVCIWMFASASNKKKPIITESWGPS